MTISKEELEQLNASEISIEALLSTEMDPEEFTRIRKEFLGLTQVELARILRMSPGVMGHYEQGVAIIPTPVALSLRFLCFLTTRVHLRIEGEKDMYRDLTKLGLEFAQGSFSTSLLLYRAFIQEHAPRSLKSDQSIADTLLTSTDSLRRWIRGEKLPSSPGKMIEIMARMVLSIEMIRLSRTRLTQETVERMSRVKDMLNAVKRGTAAKELKEREEFVDEVMEKKEKREKVEHLKKEGIVDPDGLGIFDLDIVEAEIKEDLGTLIELEDSDFELSGDKR